MFTENVDNLLHDTDDISLSIDTICVIIEDVTTNKALESTKENDMSKYKR
jgi:hypothetical protein